MRRLFTTADALVLGTTPAELRWGERSGRWRRIHRSVYGDGPEPPSELDRQRAVVLARAAVGRGHLAGVLHGLDSVELDGRPIRRDVLPPERIVVVEDIAVAGGLETLVDLAATLDDDTWEQALESSLRKRLTSVAALEARLPALGRSRTPGTARRRRVLARRLAGAPPTESLLETLMVQLARTVSGLGEPVRQHVVLWPDGTFVASVDLCWPHLGVFVELDGQHHKGQPVHDARRETAVVAATGRLPGRFTWHEVVRTPRSTARRLDAIRRHAGRRS